MGTDKLTGRWGEALAADYLRRKRYTLVAAGFSCRMGEIDLIVQNRKFIVFVEVKLRKSDAFARAADFVDLRKQARIKTTASFWLSRNETDRQPRFDVIEIYAPEGMATQKPKINWIEDAFQ